jgi:hypothetical protein
MKKKFEIKVLPTWQLNLSRLQQLRMVGLWSTSPFLYSIKETPKPWLASALLANAGGGSKPTPTPKVRITGVR